MITIKEYKTDEIFENPSLTVHGSPCIEFRFKDIIIITGTILGSNLYVMKSSKRWTLKKIISIIASSDTPDGNAEPVSVSINKVAFYLPYARMVHFQIIAKI